MNMLNIITLSLGVCNLDVIKGARHSMIQALVTRLAICGHLAFIMLLVTSIEPTVGLALVHCGVRVGRARL